MGNENTVKFEELKINLPYVKIMKIIILGGNGYIEMY